LRLILDLRHVNYLHVPKFKFERLDMLQSLAKPNDRLDTIDLRNGYWQMNMHPSAFPYLGFCWQGQEYTFRVLPFGLASAPWAFSRAVREVTALLRGALAFGC